MAQYYDWASFEKFVTELYEEEGEITVQRDVTDVDRYGAKRQTDVKITRRSRFHQFVTLVECKRWKDPVSRDRIDVLASSIEALGAQNGAIFTTTGYEEGAIAYAKGKGIELFVVRDLTDDEWGPPGRHLDLRLNVLSADFQNIRSNATAIPLVDEVPEKLELGISLEPNKALDPEFDLFSVKTGARGPNLVGVLADVHRFLLAEVATFVQSLQVTPDTITEFLAPCDLDLSGCEFRQLRLPVCAARVDCLGFVFRAHIGHSKMNIDRGEKLDFAVIVESYVSDKRLMAHRETGGAKIMFAEANRNSNSDNQEEVFKNGSVVNVFCSPWVSVGDKPANKTCAAQSVLRITMSMENGRHKLRLKS